MSNVTVADATGNTSSPEFDDLFREHHRLIYRTAFGITGSSEDAEDVLQSIFLQLIGREFPPDLRKNPRAYLYRAAVNASLNSIRSKRQHVQIVDANEIPAALSIPGIEHDDTTRKRLLHAISKLNTKAIEVLMLRYAHNYSDAQIAKMLGTTRGTIAVSLFRSRARLKRLLRAVGVKL
jgi:RNA polymerase sigma-70 factor (ECF subfamily)